MRDKVFAVVNKYVHNAVEANKVTDEIMLALLPDYTDSLFETCKGIVSAVRKCKNV